MASAGFAVLSKIRRDAFKGDTTTEVGHITAEPIATGGQQGPADSAAPAAIVASTIQLMGALGVYLQAQVGDSRIHHPSIVIYIPPYRSLLQSTIDVIQSHCSYLFMPLS